MTRPADGLDNAFLNSDASELVPRPTAFAGFRAAIDAPSCVLLLDERASGQRLRVLAEPDFIGRRR